MLGMRERVALLHGTIDVESSVGAGIRATAHLPGRRRPAEPQALCPSRSAQQSTNQASACPHTTPSTTVHPGSGPAQTGLTLATPATEVLTLPKSEQDHP